MKVFAPSMKNVGKDIEREMKMRFPDLETDGEFNDV